MLNILIPAAGKGTRFVEAGYTIPKPYLPIGDTTMLESVIKNVSPLDRDYQVYIIKPEDVPETTEGAACTALLRKDVINNDNPLLIANSDQIVDSKIEDFLAYADFYDACILTLPTDNPRYSFALPCDDEVVRTAEKKPISSLGTVGIYYWKHGSDFVKSAERMIEDNERYNNEFYICPTYNYLPRSKRIGYYTLPFENCHFLGDPAGYESYLKEYDYAK